MSVHTKKHPTKNETKVVLYGPEQNVDQLLSVAKKYEFEEESESLPAMEVLSQYVDLDKLPAISLRVHRENAEMTQKQLAEKLGVKQYHISEMENSKRPIGKELAKKIAEIFEKDYRSYL